MGRKKKSLEVEVLNESDLEKQTKDYSEYVFSNPKYSELVDPDNKYDMSDDQKEFVYLYVELKSLQVVCQTMDIEFKLGMKMFSMYSVQQEIKRLSLAKLQRRTATKLWNYAMLESYLTSFLTEVDVPANEQLSGRDKVNVARMIIDVKDRRHAMGSGETDVIDAKVDEELKQLSVDTILMLLKQDDKNVKKKELLTKLKSKYDFDEDEKKFIESLSLEELLKLIEDKGE